MLVRGKDYSSIDFLNWNVELIEDEIDIDDIEELTDESKGTAGEFNAIKNKINELVQAVKQLDKKIREE